MSKLLSIAVAAALFAALPASGFAAAQVANSETSKLCAPDAPEGYKRPGGYCDQIDDLKSLAPTSDGNGCAKIADAGFRFDEIQGRLRVAMPIDPCCVVGFNIEQQLPVDGILVAGACI